MFDGITILCFVALIIVTIAFDRVRHPL